MPLQQNKLRKTKMKKPSEVFKNIRFAKLDPHHDKGPKGSTDDEEHGAVSEVEWNQQLAHQKKRAMQEDLRNWFDKDHPEGGWKRINSKGEAVGPCAREPGEPKPKCMSNEKRAKLSKKERASAVAAKRKHDPNPERKGEPINVSNFGKGKISEDMENLEEKNVPTSPEKWAQAKAQAKAKFDVYPSAYANGWAAKKYKAMGGGWKSVSEAVKDKFDIGEYDQEGDMAKSDLRSIMANAKRVHDMLEDSTNLPEWVQSKITLAEDYISTVANYMTSEMSEEVVVEEDIRSARIIKSLYKKKGVTEEVWNKTGKEAVHRETGKKTYEYKKYDSEGKETGHREYRDEKGKSMGESVEQMDEEIAGWIAHYNGQKHEIKKHEAKDLYDAKQKAIAHFKAPKSKHGLIAVKPAYNEEVELEEGKMKDIATNREEDKRLGSWKKETPWMKTKATVTDKSGAKHTPMSRARDLARAAAKKNVKESVSISESRLADIVREAADNAKKKKKEAEKDKDVSDDKFQKDPELSTQIIRND